MGSICGSSVIKEKSVTDSDVLYLKLAPRNNNQSKQEMKKILCSINHATFVSEKQYETFVDEYEILEFLGQGLNFLLNFKAHLV